MMGWLFGGVAGYNGSPDRTDRTTGEREPMHTSRKPEWIIALLPLLGGFLMMMVGLTALDLWADEGWTIAASEDPNPVVIIEEWAVTDVHPPLYFIGLALWRQFTGDTVLELRYFSVLITMIGMALAYRLGVLMFGFRAGIIALTLYAVHDQVRVLTQEVRHYPGQLLAVVLILWCYWRFQAKPSRGRGAWFVLVGVAGLYLHYWTAFILLACGLHALIVHWGNRQTIRRVIAAALVMAALFAFWIPALINQITLERPEGLPHALENTNFVYRVLLYQLLGTPEVLWLILIVAGAVGAWTLTPRRWKPDSPALLLLLAVIIPPALTIALNAVYPILSFRALAVIVPPFILLAAHGLSRFRTPELTVMMAFILSFSLTSVDAGAIFRIDWPDVADSISSRSTPDDVLLMENYLGSHTLAYYLDHSGRDVRYAYTEHVRTFRPDDYADYLADALRSADGVWVSKSNWPGLSYDIRPELEAAGFVQTMPEVLQHETPLFLWRFDRAPDDDDAPLVTYGDELRLHRARAAFNGDVLTVNLLWSPLDVPSEEYTVSILLFGPDGISNQDSRPLDGESPTSTWEVDGLYFDSHIIDATALTSGDYRIAVQVYAFTDETFTETQNALADDCTDDTECRFVFVDEVRVD